MIDISQLCQELQDKFELEFKGEFEQVAFFKRIKTALFFCIGGIFFTNVILMLINKGEFSLVGVIGLMIFSIIGVGIVIYFVDFITKKKLESFQRKYNDKVGKYLLEKYYTNVKIHSDDDFDYTKIYDSVGYDEKYNRDDCYVQSEMKYRDKNIRLMDIRFDHVDINENGVESNKKEIFNGAFIEVSLDYNIETRIAITKEGLYGHGIGCKNKVEMDSKEFEDLFNVYADNTEKAKQLLSKEVMEIFKQMYSVSKNGFEVAIIKDKMYLRIPHDNHLFYVGIEKLIEHDYVNNDMQLLYLATAIIDNVDYAVKHNNVA